jgi:hypothetical protein
MNRAWLQLAKLSLTSDSKDLVIYPFWGDH